MTVVKSTETAEVPLSRLGLNLARYYLGNRWVLLALGAGVLVAGIGLNWSWLVAAGIAPILISVLPCLVMCGLGFCMMCRSSGQQSTPSRDAADPPTSPTALAVAKTDSSSVGAATCCREQADETQSPQATQLQPIDERRSSKGEAPMRRLTTSLLLSAILVTGAIAAPSLYAQDQKPSGSMMDHGMMGSKDGKDEGGTMGMMKMMKQVSEMMDHCNGMMKSQRRDDRPNDQWRRNAPSAPDKEG